MALLLLAAVDPMGLTGFGVAFLLVGALVVAIFAELEFVGLRLARNTATPRDA